MKPLTFEDYQAAAKRLNCEVAAIMAVDEVEAPRGGFNDDGSLTALFEPHIFYAELKDAGFKPALYMAENAIILSPVWNKTLYPGSQKGVYRQITQAVKLCNSLEIEHKFEFPYRSCSWGKFQVLGRNYKDLGFTSATALKLYLQESEANQLEVFCRFIEVNKLAVHLRKLNWDGFALKYNGKGYKLNKYHIKLKNAYEKHKKSLSK